MLILFGFGDESSLVFCDSNCMLQLHYFAGFLGFCMCDSGIVNECGDEATKRIDTSI